MTEMSSHELAWKRQWTRSTMNASGSHRRLRAPTPTEASAVAAAKLAAVCRAVEASFALAEQRTADPRLAVAVRSARAFVASIRSRVADRAAAMGLAITASVALRDRLRLEWLASSMMPGRADVRLLEECARLLAETLRSRAPHHAFVEEVARLRVAYAEAFSLGRAIASESRGDLLFAPA